jgi:hypothetical protein
MKLLKKTLLKEIKNGIAFVKTYAQQLVLSESSSFKMRTQEELVYIFLLSTQMASVGKGYG